ncbi:hypothetical protein XACLE20_1420025 [Xanthomonas citri pv. citri]|nr:hypothetical protein XACLE20_1420025 [Xanthomonas citri pv. citri]
MADVISQVWRTLAVLFVWDVLITIIYYVLPFRAPALPLTIFGSALALFLGFRANSTYQRWWEGRVLWGQMINASRNLVRLSVSILSAPEAGDLGRTIALRQIAYVNALRCQLRRLPVAGCRWRWRCPRMWTPTKRRRWWCAPMWPTACSTSPDAAWSRRGALAGSTASSRPAWNASWWISPTHRAAWNA